MKNSVFITLFAILFASLGSAQAMECTDSAIKAKAMEKLAVAGAQISISNPTPIFEKHNDSKSSVIGYSVRFYQGLAPGYGVVGALEFYKIGEFCTGAALMTAETVTAIGIPRDTANDTIIPE